MYLFGFRSTSSPDKDKKISPVSEGKKKRSKSLKAAMAELDVEIQRVLEISAISPIGNFD